VLSSNRFIVRLIILTLMNDCVVALKKPLRMLFNAIRLYLYTCGKESAEILAVIDVDLRSRHKS